MSDTSSPAPQPPPPAERQNSNGPLRPPLNRNRSAPGNIHDEAHPPARHHHYPHRKQFVVSRHGVHNRVPSYGRNLNRLGGVHERESSRTRTKRDKRHTTFELGTSPAGSEGSRPSSFKDDSTDTTTTTAATTGAAGRLVKSSSTRSLQSELVGKKRRKAADRSNLHLSTQATGHRRVKSHDGRELAEKEKLRQLKEAAKAEEARKQQNGKSAEDDDDEEEEVVEEEDDDAEELRKQQEEQQRRKHEEEQRQLQLQRKRQQELLRRQQAEQERQLRQQREQYEQQQLELQRQQQLEQQRQQQEAELARQQQLLEQQQRQEQLEQQRQLAAEEERQNQLRQQEAEYHARQHREHLARQQAHQQENNPPSSTMSATLTPPTHSHHFPHPSQQFLRSSPHSLPPQTPAHSLPSSHDLPTTSRFLPTGTSPSNTSSHATRHPPPRSSPPPLNHQPSAAPLTRTQQKLLLQRAAPEEPLRSPQTDQWRGYHEKEMERVAREYRNVRRFRDPVMEGVERVREMGRRVPGKGKAGPGGGEGRLSTSLKERGEGRLRVRDREGEVGELAEETAVMRLWRRGELLVSNE